MAVKIKIAVAGLGGRGKDTYGALLLKMKDKAQVVAIADCDDEKLELMGEAHNVPAMRFASAEEMFEKPKLADAVLICTQDRQHVPHALAALDKGYDILLEKPISPDLDDLQKIVRQARIKNRTVVVCHVLRYTPFFTRIKQAIDSNVLGEIVAIQARENVCYWHQAHSYVRGNWRRSGETSPMILSKCCHDLDYLVWLCGKQCRSVSSFGSLMHFRSECAPEGAALRCLDGCKAKDACPYDAEKIYLTNKTGVLSGNTGWPCSILSQHPSEKSMREALENGPYGRCVYHCDNDVVDHQVVNMEMEGGATLTLTMSAFTSDGGRTIKIMGTHGDLWGDITENILRITPFGKPAEVIDVSTLSDDFTGHAGGDKLLLEQFIGLLEGKTPDSKITTLETSVESHLIAIAAEHSRLNGGMSVAIAPMRGDRGVL